MNDRLFFNIDYDNAIMLGNQFDGLVLKVKKSVDVIIFPIVKGSIQPFIFGNEWISKPMYPKLEYKRVGNTHIFYCHSNGL